MYGGRSRSAIQNVRVGYLISIYNEKKINFQFSFFMDMYFFHNTFPSIKYIQQNVVILT